MRDVLATVPTPPPEDLSRMPDPMTRRGSPRLEGYATLAAVGLVAALVLAGPSSPSPLRPSRVVLAIGLQLAREPRLDVQFSVAGERTRAGRRSSTRRSWFARRPPIDRLELLLDLPKGVKPRVTMPSPFASVPAKSARSPVQLRCSRWGVYDVGTIEAPRSRRVPARRLGGSARPTDRSEGLPARGRRWRESSTRPRRRRSRGARSRRDEGRRNRIRRHPRLRPRRPSALHQLARVRPSNEPRGQRAASRSETPTSCCSWTASRICATGDRSTLDDAIRAAAALATRYLERRDRVGLVSFGGVLRWLRPGWGRLNASG